MAPYDNIGRQYDFIKTIPFNVIEQHNFRRAIQPFFTKSNCYVIEFACGTGFYSERMLSWGATHVTGLDISGAMIEGAMERLAQSVLSSGARFLQGDGGEPKLYSPPAADKFDLAAGTWFLNYTQSSTELLAMFKTVALNLKDKGVFVGICLPPVEDFISWISKCGTDAVNETGLRYEYLNRLENGEG